MSDSTLLQATYKGKHIKLGDIVHFEQDNETDYYAGISDIVHQYGEIIPVFHILAYTKCNVLEEDHKNETGKLTIDDNFTVCSKQYFDKLIQQLENEIAAYPTEPAKAYDEFCKNRNKTIAKYKSLKELAEAY